MMMMIMMMMMVMMYFWSFWEPWSDAMLVVLLPKLLIFDWKSWLAQLFLDVFVTLCGVNPYWTQKSFKINNFT